MSGEQNGRQTPTGNLSRMPTDLLARRAEQFARATSGKGLPMTWGVGREARPGFAPAAPKPRRRK